MIDEHNIFASKLTRTIDAVRHAYKLRDGSATRLFALVSAAACLRSQLSVRPAAEFQEIREQLEHLFEYRQSNIVQLDTVFEALFRLLAERIGYHKGLRLPAYPAGAIQEAVDSVLKLHSDDSTHNSQRFLKIFESLFLRVAGEAHAVEYRNSEKFACLAKALSQPEQAPWEYFPTFASFSLKLADAMRPRAYASMMSSHEFLLRIRFWLNGVLLQKLGVDEVPPNAFALINHPQYKSATPSLLAKPNTYPDSSLAALAAVFDSQNGIGSGIAVVPGRDRTSAGSPATVRQEMLMSGFLVAIVDVPIYTGPGHRSPIASVLVFSEKPLSRENVLCIDATVISAQPTGIESASPAIAEMALIAAIIKSWINTLEGLPATGVQALENRFDTLFANNFAQGYTDVPGLCKAVSQERLEEKDFSIKASAYVQGEADQEWKSMIDSSLVRALIDRPGPHRFCAYIIGNNGAGKSLLLGELIKYFKRKKMRCVGISFGTTDRFPLERGSAQKGGFVYRGARTGKQALNYESAATGLARLTKRIHTQQKRLDVFDEAMVMLGFERRHYLVPLDFVDTDGDYTDKQLEKVVVLSDKAEENADTLRRHTEKRHQLALIRRNERERERVIVFGKLSSGEQQILTLVIKLLAEAENNTVFLIDEPEISLHVQWQRMVPRILDLIGRRMECSMITATHAPVIIASATRKADHCFIARHGGLTKLELRSSHSVDTVLFDDFETYTENSRRVHERCAHIVKSVISAINDDTKDAAGAVDALRNELHKITEIINRADQTVSPVRKDADLNLIRQAETAIDEILANHSLQAEEEI